MVTNGPRTRSTTLGVRSRRADSRSARARSMWSSSQDMMSESSVAGSLVPSDVTGKDFRLPTSEGARAGESEHDQHRALAPQRLIDRDRNRAKADKPSPALTLLLPNRKSLRELAQVREHVVIGEVAL